MAEYAIPGGPEKGTPLSEAKTGTIEWWAGTITKNLASGTSKYPDRDKPLLAAMQAELAQRGGGQPPATNGGRTAVATQPVAVDLIVGTFRDAARATEALRRAAEVGHLIAPMTVCPTLPEGCELAVSMVILDVENETYEAKSGRHSLGKTALDRIGGAAGISWDPILSCCLDDRREPRYCHYRSVGRVRSFDGQIRELNAEVEIDARDGSPQIEEIVTKAAAATDKRTGKPAPRDPASQILELRKFILRVALSKSRNNAAKVLGIRGSYSREELKKPFIAAKLIFTGQSDDPEARREFRAKIADSFLGGTRTLYGEPSASPPSLPPPYHVPALEARRANGSEKDGVIDVTHAEPTSAGGAGPHGCTGCPDAPGGLHLPECPLHSDESGERY